MDRRASAEPEGQSGSTGHHRGQRDLDVDGDKVMIPDRLPQEINVGTAAFADHNYRKAMDIGLALESVRKATESRLTLLARARQPKIVYLYEKGDPTAYIAAYNAYREEIGAQCKQLTDIYLAAGADTASLRMRGEVIDFQTFDVDQPRWWRVQRYHILSQFFSRAELEW